MIRFFFPLIVLLSFSQQDRSFPASKSVSPDSVKTATDSILHRWLGKQVVENNEPPFKTLWFFVSEKELDSIALSGQLMRSFKMETDEEKRYYAKLTDPKFDLHPVASILRASEKLRIHDAWTSYWPLLQEYPFNPFYRNQLVQVVLEDSALCVQFQPNEKNPFIVYDVYGNIVSQSQAIKREKHIAAVFMYSFQKESTYGEYKPGKTIMMHRRSFYLVNEKMIRHWQHATPPMQDGILKELNYLLLLDAWIKDSPLHNMKGGKKGQNILEAWNCFPSRRSIPQQVFACGRSSTGPFGPNDGIKIDRAIAAIRGMWPLQVKTMEKFPSRGIR